MGEANEPDSGNPTDSQPAAQARRTTIKVLEAEVPVPLFEKPVEIKVKGDDVTIKISSSDFAGCAKLLIPAMAMPGVLAALARAAEEGAREVKEITAADTKAIGPSTDANGGERPT